ncbi:hypothetical protein IJG93_00495 [Candidatus Saccharibacteria bacterium]|nr:hypothetical protein [Candidatus Saccharibacteria bacterium]
MAKKKELLDKIAQLEAEVAKIEDTPVEEPKKKTSEKQTPTPEEEPELVVKPDEQIESELGQLEPEQPEVAEAPEEKEPEAAEVKPEPEDAVSEPQTPEEMRAKAERMEAGLKKDMERLNAEKKAYEAKIQELLDKAEAIEKAEAEAKAKAEAEEKARKEAEEKAKAEAEAQEKAEAEAKAKTKADLLASINKADKPRVGKAYKWWDYDTATWNITADVWSANQLSDKWEVVYVWYRNGEIERLLNKEEMEKHCPK